MKKQKPKWPWDAPGFSPEKKVILLKQWTFDLLRKELDTEAAREEARYADVDDPATDAESEAYSRLLLVVRENPLLRIRAAIKSKNVKEIARLTKDDRLRELAWREALDPPEGRRKGERRKGQHFIDEFEAEMLDSLADDVRRVRAIWKKHKLTRTAGRFSVTAEQIVVEALLGSEKDWKRPPKEILTDYPDASRARTWEERRKELDDALTNWMKNKRTKPRKRKPRRKSAR